jgi:HPt (histidine-containing phosphotransfer) domain-containing protein
MGATVDSNNKRVSTEGKGLYDLTQLHILLQNNQEKVNGLLKVFIETSSKNISELGEALGNGDAEAARRLAHTVKGSAALLKADVVSNLAFEIERMGEEGDLSSAMNKYDLFVKKYSDLEKQIQATLM